MCPCSDSGDSVFITQRAVPEAVRSGRRRSPHQRSYRTSHSFLTEDDTLSSDSNIESKPKIRRLKKKLPKYSFDFVCGQKWKPKSSLIAHDHNERLHVKMNHEFISFTKLDSRRLNVSAQVFFFSFPFLSDLRCWGSFSVSERFKKML